MLKKYLSKIYLAIRFSIKWVENLALIWNKFQQDENWERYIVDPPTYFLGGSSAGYDQFSNPFPTIDYVVHTVLERFPGLIGFEDERYLYFLLVDNNN